MDDSGKKITTAFWTGTDVGGIKTPFTCGNWGAVDAGSLATGTMGQSGSTAVNWTNYGADSCTGAFAVLCIEQ
jgi:hypothetical protein